ncbi:MAG: sulfotransferase family protein [Parachlamydia sp.]|nr:sulfotransferase family protein [Parachlamydia sp.]
MPKTSIFFIFLGLFALLPFSSQARDHSLPAYNMTVGDGFVWFRCAKVGTRTIYNILSTQAVLVKNQSRIAFDPIRYKKSFKFAFVRNPWDRMVSCYFNKVVTQCHPNFALCFGRSFEEFVYYINSCDLAKSDIHIRLQTELIPIEHVDFIGRMESFSEDLGYVLNKLGIRYRTIPRKNRSSHEHYSKYYNNITRKIIADKYKADIKAFDYRFETEGS